MNPHLFVYGSLVAAAAHPKGARLRQEALFLGPATIAGRLYRVTWFPAILPAEGPGDRVYGELYRLVDPIRSLVWLDTYEGITPGGSSAAAPDQYIRAERPVMTARGGTEHAWVYLYQRPLPVEWHIPDGMWRR